MKLLDKMEEHDHEQEEEENGTEEELMRALRSALRCSDGGKNGVLVLGPSGSGKTELVRRCVAKLGCSMDYGNALTVRSRAYFADMDPRESGYVGSSFRHFFSGAPSPPTVLVVDDLDTLVQDMNQGLDGLLKLLAAPPKTTTASSSSSSVTRKKSSLPLMSGKKASSLSPPPPPRVCVCIATSRHKSDKRLLDVYRRCIEVKVALPLHWDGARGAAPRAPAAIERTLYPLVHDLLTRPMRSADAATSGLSEPDKVTVGLLVHENIHDYRGPDVPDATIAAIAHDHASADAIGTLQHQAQTWHLWELCFLLRTFRTNLRLFPSSASSARGTTTEKRTPSFTKLLTRCSTEVGTRAFLTDMCFRLGCAWHELLPKLAVLDAEYTDLVSRPAPHDFLVCLRQCHSVVPSSSTFSSSSSTAPRASMTAARTTSTIARMEWLRMRLVAQLVPHQGTTYCPEMSMAEVRRMYRCLRAESAAAASGQKRSASQKNASAVEKKRRTAAFAEEEEVEEEEEECQEEDDDDAEPHHLSEEEDDDDEEEEEGVCG